MTNFHKAGLGLLVLAALSQGGAAHAAGFLDVKPATPTDNAGVYTYSYSITSTPVSFPGTTTPTPFDPYSINFTFADPNVSFLSGPAGFSAAQTGGNIVVSSTTTSLMDGTPATFAFTSTDAPQVGLEVGTLSVFGMNNNKAPEPNTSPPITASGPSPAAVPEASTTVSFGLMLALGGAAVVFARRKAVKNAA